MKTLAKMLVICCWCMCTFVQAEDGPKALKSELETVPTQQKITLEKQIQLDYLKEKAERQAVIDSKSEAVESDEQKYLTLKDLFTTLTISQALIYCNSIHYCMLLYEIDNHPLQKALGLY